jgi:hypothetical protein
MSPAAHEEEFVPKVEGDRVSRKFLATVALVALAVAIVSVVAADALLQSGRAASAAPKPVEAADQIGTVEQTLIVDTRRGLDEAAKDRQALDRFGWIDRSRGVAKIPIDDAMDLVTDPAFVRHALATELPDAGGQEGM